MKVSQRKNKTLISERSASDSTDFDENFLEPVGPTITSDEHETLALVRSIKEGERSLRVRRTDKPWQAKLDKHVSEDLLLTRHKELLNKRHKEVVVVGWGFAREVRVIDMGPDTSAVSKGLELGYKLRGRLNDAPAVTPPTANIYNLFLMPAVQEKVRAFEDSLKQSIANAKPIDAEVRTIESSGPENREAHA